MRVTVKFNPDWLEYQNEHFKKYVAYCAFNQFPRWNAVHFWAYGDTHKELWQNIRAFTVSIAKEKGVI